ncbi:MAG: hypothetical protein H7210_14150 [Pyrinomonadaceae bacterium]|nr:hypothetical protein [Phycisphaerales bacterium]
MSHRAVSRRFTAATAALLAGCAGPAVGDVVYFDNSGGEFVWEESWFFGDFHHGTSLDITLPPSQSGEATPYSLQSYSEIYFTSGQLVTTSLTPDQPGNVTVARGPETFVNPGPWSGNVDPAIAFAAGDPIGPAVPGGTWGANADVDWRSGIQDVSLIDGHAFIGVCLQLPDGPHYGWIDLVDNGYNAGRSFVALGWAWETTPNTALPAGTVPGPAALACFAVAGVSALRRRRRS